MTSTFNQQDDFKMFVDTDHASNTEVQNKLRSQNGFICMQGEAPIYWSSKVHSFCFAHKNIGEAHPDMSSAAVEIYGVGNGTMDGMAISYLVEECGMSFTLPFDLWMDNTAAERFSNNAAHTTKLKHIDA